MRAHGCGEHGNRISPRSPGRYQPAIRKVPASTVPFGESISRNSRTVWAAFDDAEVLVAVAATAGEVRAKYREVMRQRAREKAEAKATR